MLAVTSPVIICPSMNTHMYESRPVQRNLNTLEADGYIIIEPEEGELACGTTGAGRLPEPYYIADRLISTMFPNDLKGKKVLVTAGPTKEPIDPVRYISNHSSGKMGYVVARPGIQTMTDLKGKKIGILSFGSCDEYFIRRMLKMEGVNPNTEIELVSLGDCYGDLNCFTTGQIDAGFIGEPKVTQGEHLGLFKVLARVGDYFPKYQWGVIFARNDFIEKQPELLARILEGFRNACRYIQENPEETIELGSKLFDVSTEVFRGALHRDLANWEVDAKVDIEGLNNCLKIQAEAGAIAHVE